MNQSVEGKSDQHHTSNRFVRLDFVTTKSGPTLELHFYNNDEKQLPSMHLKLFRSNTWINTLYQVLLTVLNFCWKQCFICCYKEKMAHSFTTFMIHFLINQLLLRIFHQPRIQYGGKKTILILIKACGPADVLFCTGKVSFLHKPLKIQPRRRSASPCCAQSTFS